MNRSKKLYLLLGVLAAVCIATLAVMRAEQHKEQIRTSEEVVLALDGSEISALSWQYAGNTLAFHKEDRWQYDGDAAFPVSEEKISGLLETFEAFGVSFVIEDVEDYGQYGLDAPVCTIEVTAARQTWQILLGGYSSMDSKRYVSIGDGKVYLVQNDPLEVFDLELRDLIENDETPAFEKVSSVEFSGSENYSIFFEENSTATYSAQDVYFTRQNGKDCPLDPARVESYLRTVTALHPTNYVTYNATEKELQQYGLDSPELTVTVGYTAADEGGSETPRTFVLQISRDPAERAAQGAAEDEQDTAREETVTAYARIGDSPIIYKLPSGSYQQLMAASYDDLRHAEVLWAGFEDIEQVEVTLEGVSYTFRSEKSGDDRTWFYQDAEISLESFQNAVRSLYAGSFTDEKPAQKEEISLTVSLDNENLPIVRITLYRYDGTRCLAVVDGQPVSLVDRSAVVSLAESVRAIVWE